jgi:hypothetical protein
MRTSRAVGVFALAALVVSIAAVALHETMEVSTETQGQEVETRGQEVVLSDGYITSLPLVFELNQGQSDSRVKVLARTGGVVLFLTSDGYALELCEGDGSGAGVTCDVLRMRLLAANPAPRIAGLERLPGVSNYLISSDRAAWRTGVPHFARVRYEEVYPGIDLLFYSNEGQLEYDFIVAPGVDHAAIRFAYTGADSITIDGAGNLVVATATGDLRQHAPIVYQETDAGRTEIAGAFTVTDEGQVGFDIGPYAPGLPLVIDPVLEFSTFLGGVAYDSGRGIAIDAAGNIYVAGKAESADFPTANALYGALGGDGSDGDAFVSKLSPNGRTLLFSTFIGGSRYDEAQGIGIDRDANIYVTGDTGSSDFPTDNAIQPEKAGPGRDCFVVRLDPEGQAIQYSTFFGGGRYEYTKDIAVRPNGETYVLGETLSTDFPTWSPFYGTNAGEKDLFVFKLPPSGLYAYWSSYLGGSLDEEAGGIAVDGDGNAYVTGETASSDFPTTAASQPAFAGGTKDIFVARLHFLAFWVDYATFLGGSEGDYAGDIAVDRVQRAHVLGHTASSDFPTKDAYQPELAGGTDFSVTRLADDGTIEISTFLGGNTSDDGKLIVTDRSGSIYVAGATNSTDFPTVNPFQPVRVGNQEIVLARFGPNGRTIDYSTYLGGSGNDYIYGMVVDAQGELYAAGQTGSSDFPTVAALQPTKGGTGTTADAFVIRVATPLDFFIASARRPESSEAADEDR